MVIDDEPELLSMVQDVLVWAGYDVLVADHPEHVMQSNQERQPDLFLIDVMLPQTSGIEVAQHLRGHGHAATPMIGMSASRLMRQMAANSSVFTTVIDKPFEITALLELLRQLLNDDVRAHAQP
jgi:two-component system OmpR family response regulator